MTPASEVKHYSIDWLWPGRIARAKLTLLTGAPGSGKSALVASIIAAVTTGGTYPCGEGRAPEGSVILVCPDGDPDVLIPRLKAAGADLTRVQIICQVQGAKGPRPFDLATDVSLLDDAVRTLKGLRAILIDALNLPTGRAAAQATRALLDPLAALAKDHDLAMLAILQPTGSDRRASKPVSLDALALGAARAAFALETDPADESRRLLLPLKNELAPEGGIVPFRIIGREIAPGQSAARIAFEPQHHPLSPREFMARQARGFNSARTEAIEFLRGLMGSARHLKLRHVEQEARAAGLIGANQALSKCRVLREARMAMGLTMTRESAGGGAWVWAKPQASPAPQAKPSVASPPLQPAQMQNAQAAQAKR
jgi:hypothetical protein